MKGHTCHVGRNLSLFAILDFSPALTVKTESFEDQNGTGETRRHPFNASYLGRISKTLANHLAPGNLAQIRPHAMSGCGVWGRVLHINSFFLWGHAQNGKTAVESLARS